jgi:protein-arginine kinase activator protein McsA
VTPTQQIIEGLQEYLSSLDHRVRIHELVMAKLTPHINSRDERIIHLTKVVNKCRENLPDLLKQGDINCSECYGIGLVGKDGSACTCVTMKGN